MGASALRMVDPFAKPVAKARAPKPIPATEPSHGLVPPKGKVCRSLVGVGTNSKNDGRAPSLEFVSRLKGR